MLARKTNQFKTQKLAFVKALLCKSKGSQQGLSMLECLVAIVVVAAVISAITPPIMLSVATRVQMRRAEQARQLAQAKIDEIRRLVETGNYTKDDLNRIAPSYVGGRGQICNATIPFDQAKQAVDIDKGLDNRNNQNKPDFWVQAFRNEGVIDPNTDRPVAFDLGVRVYRYYEGQIPNQTKRASIGFTSAEGSQRSKPLVTLYSRVVLSDTQNSQQNYKTIIDANLNPLCPQ
ncbi:prepilin-type N-terminal cleavage/methylation domain-containing protein [[Phormidium ambiguum] IAM M-71]|nr:prepilin-type N-terminal cleavage/methylation domain-containing protein [Phormidium ambiguum]